MDLTGIPDPEALRKVLAEEGGSDVALIEPDGPGDPFYVGLDDDGNLVKLEL